MYRIEQDIYKLKFDIRNRTRLEASITEGYLADDSMILYLRYLHSMENKFNHPHRSYENQVDNDRGLRIFNHPNCGLGSSRVCTMLRCLS